MDIKCVNHSIKIILMRRYAYALSPWITAFFVPPLTIREQNKKLKRKRGVWIASDCYNNFC